MQAYARRAQMTSWLTLFAQTGLHPSRRPTCVPSTNRPQHRCETRNEPAGQANIECLRETGLRDRAGTGSQATMSTDRGRIARWIRSPEFARVVRMAGSRTGIYEDSSQAGFARWCLRGAIPAAGSHAGIRESARRAGSAGHKKRRSEERRPSPHNYGRKPDPP